MSATSLDLSQIKTDALSAAASFRALIGLGAASSVTFSQVNASTGAYYFSSSTASSAFLSEGTNIVALRHSVNAQTYRVYNTFTDASNFERGKMEWVSNAFRIGTEKAGTGIARDLEFQTDGTTRLTIASTGLATFNGNINLGTNGIIRTRYVNNGDNFLTFWEFVPGTSGAATYALGATAPIMRFGGTTSSFPAIKRNAAALNFRLANDSADCNITAGALTLSSNLTIGAYTLPTTDGSSGQTLTTNGAGAVTWQSSDRATTAFAVAMAVAL